MAISNFYSSEINHFQRSVRFKITGATLLEAGFAIGVTLTTTLLLFDINSAFQAYSAAQQSARQSLRCLFPVDGECNLSLANSEPPRRDFRVFSLNNNSQIFGREYDYDGRARWLEAGVYSVEQADFNQVTTGIERFRTQNTYAVRIWRTGGGDVDYTTEIGRGPYIDGTPTNPRFQMSANNSSSYPPIQGGIPYGNIGGNLSSRGSIYIGATSWVAVDPPAAPSDPRSGGVRCYRRDSSGNVNFNSACNLGSTNLVFDIQGSASNTATGAQGVITLEIQYRDRQTRQIVGSRDLGGRMFDSGTGANAYLVPRGTIISSDPAFTRASASYLSYASSYPEITLHKNITLPYNQEFRLRFWIEKTDSGSGRVSWRLTNLRGFKANYNQQLDFTPCLHHVPELAFSRPNETCATNHPAGAARNIRQTGSYQYTENLYLGCIRTNPSEGLLQSELQEYILRNSLNGPYDFPWYFSIQQLLGGLSCGNGEFIFNCPSNKGVNDPQENNPSTLGLFKIISPFEAQRICPPPTGIPASGSTEIIDWFTKPVTINFQPFLYKIKDCLENEVDYSQLPESLRAYKKLRLKLNQAVDWKKIKLGGDWYRANDPNQAKIEDQRFNCPRVRAQEKILDEDLENHNLPANSLFVGARSDLGCSRDQILRDDAAEKIFKDHEFYLADINQRYVKEVPRATIPSDSCTPYRLAYSETNGETYLGTFPEGQIPQFCKENKNSCRVELAGVTYGGKSEDKINDLKLAAQKFGEQNLKAFFPHANFSGNCSKQSSFYCANVAIDYGGSDLIRATASVNVPFIFLKAFGKESANISYTEQAKLETALLK
ncbi:MAG TPA: hypothetical protein PKD37_07980 [Oligoflexia bacterium]|nr:hypothetical protein [Oligoflexia bacterium]HMP27901.1 hypothetical protein [Oligoflexia bacterium]